MIFNCMRRAYLAVHEAVPHSLALFDKDVQLCSHKAESNCRNSQTEEKDII